jgi:pimeloyl-ACP methyl ester carboxylesterase
VICNAIGHEHTRSFRNLQQLAVRLSQIGFEVIRFDYAGTGNSQGKPADMSLPQWQQDVSNVIQYAKERQHALDPHSNSKVSVLGIRLGGTFLAQTQLDGIEHAILWDPVLDGSVYLNQLRSLHRYELRSLTRFLRLRQAHHEQLMGYRYSIAIQNEIESIRIPDSGTGRAQSNWIITSKDQLLPSSALQNMSHWNHCECLDEIYWYESRYVQSAFSSPHANRQIEAILTEGSNR